MRINTKRIALLLAFISLIVLIPFKEIYAATTNTIITTADGFKFDKATKTIIDHSGKEENLIIPTEIDGVSVEALGDRSISGYYLLKSVTIKKNIKRMEGNPFARSTLIASINVDDDNEFFSSMDGVLFDKKKEKIYHYPWMKRGTEYEIPESVLKIGKRAFSSSELNRIVIPRNAKEIEESAFSGCGKLTGINIPDGMVSIMSGAFMSCFELSSIYIPDSVINLGTSIFNYCKKLESVRLSENIDSIPAGTFETCEKIKNIHIPNKVTSIGGYAFANCKSLENIKIPDNVNYIRLCAFYGCRSLTEANIPKGIKKIELNTFSLCNKLKEIILPDNLEEIAGEAFTGCSVLTNIDIPDGLKIIGTRAFGNCYGFTKIKIPNSVESIGDSTFTYCGNLKEVEIPEGIDRIGIDNFRNCINLEKVLIPKSVKRIGDNAFINCDNVTIYGYEGSYAQTYAFKNSIPFYSLNGSSRTYGIKVIDKQTKTPISDVKILSESTSVKTDESGLAMLPLAKQSSFKLEISKVGYKSINETQNVLPNTINVIEMERDSNKAGGINFICPPDSQDTLNGPQISLFEKKSNLFKVEVGTSQPWFNNLKYDVDVEKKTIKVLLGLKEEASVSPDYNNPNDAYWRQSYNDMKDLVKKYNGRVDTPDLWNRYSKIRGKLKKIDSQAGFSTSGYIAGYLEFSYSSGEPVLTEGGALFTADMGVSSKTPFPAALPIAYMKFGISAGVEGNFKFVMEESKGVKFNGEFGFSVKPNVAVGIGSKKIANIESGLNGKLKCTLDVPKPISEGFEAKLSAEFYIKASILGLYEDCKSYEFGELTLYSNKNKEKNSMLMADAFNISKDNFKLMSREYLREGTYSLKRTYGSSYNERFNKENIYPYCNPIMKNLDSGKRIMVWVDDLGAAKRSSINRTCLMYSIYNGSSWSEPKAVYDDNTGDFSPQLYVDGNRAYLIWENANKIFDDNATYQEVSSSCDIVFSELNGDVFTKPININENGNDKFENNPRLSAQDGEISIVWMENSDNDPFMQNGKNSIYRRKIINGNLQNTEKIKEDINLIYDIDTGYIDGANVIAYSCDKDGDFTTDNDTELKVVKDGQSPNNIYDIGNIDDVQFVNGKIYWNLDGKIKSMSSKDISSIEEVGDIGYRGDFKVLEGQSNKLILWIDQDGFTKEIVGSYYDNNSKKLSTPIKITNLNKGIRIFSPILKDDGKIAVAYNVSDIEKIVGDSSSPYGKTNLVVEEDLKNFDLEVDSFLEVDNPIGYLHLEGTPISLPDESYIEPNSNLKLKANVRNNSFEKINKLKLTLYNENNGKIKEEVVECSLKPGESQYLTTTYKVPETLKKQKIKLEVSRVDGEEINTKNNVAIGEFGYSDLMFKEYELAKDSLGYVAKGIVKNRGFDVANNVKVTLYKNGSYGTKIGEINIKALVPGEEKEITFRIPDEYNLFSNEYNNNLFTLEVSSDSIESSLSNNTVQLFSSPIKVTGIALDKSELNMNNGNQKTLIAMVNPTNAINKNVVWLSSNTDIATVDENGVITAIAEGEVTISATSIDGNYTESCKVKIFHGYDFNFDGKVDKADLDKIGNHYNAKIGDENYLKEMDINDDGIIDLYDIAIVAMSIKE